VVELKTSDGQIAVALGVTGSVRIGRSRQPSRTSRWRWRSRHSYSDSRGDPGASTTGLAHLFS
jgi:hypothetical protein